MKWLKRLKQRYLKWKLMEDIRLKPIDTSILSRYVWYAVKAKLPDDDKTLLRVETTGRSRLLHTEMQTDYDKNLKIDLFFYDIGPNSPKGFCNLKLDVQSRMSGTNVQAMSVQFRDVLDYENISITAGNFAIDEEFIQQILAIISSSMIYTLSQIKETELWA